MIERAAPSKCLEKCSNYDRQIRLCKKGHLDLCYLRNCRDFEKRKEKDAGTEQGEHRGIASREARKTGFLKLKTSEELLFAKALTFANISFTPNPVIEGLEVDFLIRPNLLIDIGISIQGSGRDMICTGNADTSTSTSQIGMLECETCGTISYGRFPCILRV